MKNRERWKLVGISEQTAAVPWLWEAFFAEIQPHPLPHVPVDLHQGAHGSIADLKTRENLDFPITVGFVTQERPKAEFMNKLRTMVDKHRHVKESEGSILNFNDG